LFRTKTVQTEQHQMNEVVQTAAKFASRRIVPDAMETDHFDPRFPVEVFEAGIEAGFDRFILPESAGGHGFTPADLYALVKTLAESCAGHAMVFGIHAAALKTLFDAATPTSAALVDKILSSHQPIAVAIPEPIAATDFEPTLTATQGKVIHVFGQGGLAINGAASGWFLLFTKTADGLPLAFLSAANPKTLVPGEPETTLGLRAMPLCLLNVENHELPEASLISQGSAAFSFYRSLLSNLSMATAAASCGLMNSALKKALRYAGERYQGGKMIIDHSHARSILGRMSSDAIASWGAVSYLAAQEQDHVAALGTKVSVTESAVKVCTDAVQVLGGYGYMRDYGLEKGMRDAAVLSLLPVSNARAELLITAIEKEELARF
jgi:alkylation response protein AidB-like acyl-CoA dehydrogenase